MRGFRHYRQRIEEFIGVSEGLKRVKPPRIEANEVDFDAHAIDEYLGFHPRKKLMKAIMQKVGKIDRPVDSKKSIKTRNPPIHEHDEGHQEMQ